MQRRSEGLKNLMHQKMINQQKVQNSLKILKSNKERLKMIIDVTSQESIKTVERLVRR